MLLFLQNFFSKQVSVRWGVTLMETEKKTDQTQPSVRKKPLVKWQKPNVGVLYALIPTAVASIYFFGWRSLLLLVSVNIAGFLTEFIFLKIYYKEPVTSAVFVSSCLFTLTLPPTLPIWMAVVGIVFGIAIGKMAFGGFGRNIFNPALTGRAFIYVSFGAPMTAAWVQHIGGVAGGFAAFASNAVTKATPMIEVVKGIDVSKLSMLFGNEAGCLGETSALLILLGGIFILIKKYASYRIVFSGFIAMLVLQTVFWMIGINAAIDPLSAVLSGGWMLGILFMATDPVSASQTNTGRWIYGALIGSATSLIRVFSIWPEGVMFSVLLGNMFAPIIDYYIKQSKKKNAGAQT
jgi:Na+-transporting NADH:ubiquinone oxidoreductase subunit B